MYVCIKNMSGYSFLLLCTIRCSKTLVNDQEDARESATHLLSSVLAAALSGVGAGEASHDLKHISLLRVRLIIG